ncbi:hypothetical protein AAFF_G00361970 [Aldrovandia affinis]|uniref:Uncharacterized protein n=1 Tax=Aldrovandia affinis TaxID=143900 RepID=A0AAD7WN57_9TELE|nr:hypothetical protein AAFF_G00361970 [Aldrovandia affinis]
MKGYHVTRSLSQHATGPCVCGPEDLDIARSYTPHPQDYYAYYTPGVSHDPSSRRIPSYGGGTFPRSHPGQRQPYDPGPAPHHGHAPRKAQRATAGHLEQYERQLEGFHTLQYQRAATGGEQRERAESPSRIRHLVHSVQRLFTKSHSLEAPSKRQLSNGGGRERGHHHPTQRASRSARRSKSHDRTKSRDPRPRGRNSGWWSSDDNLDSDSGYPPASRGRRGHHTLEGAVQDLTLRTLRAPGDCATCSTVALMGDPGPSVNKSAWAAMTVSQARDVTPSPRVEREQSLHLLQVPSEEWGGACVGGASGNVGEIPCRRMRSGSYIRAMGDDESVDSDTSPTPTPKKALLQREAFRRSVSMDQQPNKYSCKQCANTYANSRTMPKNHNCMHVQRGESMCESVFGDFGESQAVNALDLPGSFRARSHSYVRAIQAGVSQDDDCLPVFSLSGPQGGAKGAAVFPHKRKLPPPPATDVPAATVCFGPEQHRIDPGCVLPEHGAARPTTAPTAQQLRGRQGG